MSEDFSPMEWNNWIKYYRIIMEKLNINEEEDVKAAHILSQLLDNKNDKNKIEAKLNAIINGSTIFVYGCGPSLKGTVQALNNMDRDVVNIAADGAISVLLENNIFCHVNTSDLDGNVEDSIRANASGTITVIHAHGDNIPLLREYVQKFPGQVLGSTQVRPFGNLINYGGFTDGDRGILLGLHFNCKRIILVGFDFGSVVGEYSKPDLKEHIAGRNKRIKLQFASYLISEILKRYDVEIFTLSNTYNIEGLKSISVESLETLIENVNSK